MIRVQIYRVTPLETNCSYLVDEATGASAVVDPGDESRALNAQIEQDGGKLTYVMLTHGHYDHICYAKQLAEKYGAKIVTGRHNDRFLSDAYLNGTGRHGLDFTPFHADILLDDGETFKLGETEITYLCGRTDLPSGDDHQTVQSLKRLKDLDGDYQVVPGHGPLTTLEHERRYNPFMRRL